MRSPHPTTRERPPLAATREKPEHRQRPSTINKSIARINNNNKIERPRLGEKRGQAGVRPKDGPPCPTWCCSVNLKPRKGKQSTGARLLSRPPGRPAQPPLHRHICSCGGPGGTGHRAPAPRPPRADGLPPAVSTGKRMECETLGICEKLCGLGRKSLKIVLMQKTLDNGVQ